MRPINLPLSAFCLLIFCFSAANAEQESINNLPALRKREHGGQRELLFLKKRAIMSILSPTRGSIVHTSGPDTEPLDVEVSYNDGSFFGRLLETFTDVELVMNGEVVGKRSGSLGRTGKETFTVDMTETGVGTHKLQARGTLGPKLFGELLQRTVASEEIPITIDCNPDNSFLFFTGHDEASSVKTGEVNLTWSPALAFGLAEERFIWCGPVKYDVLVADGPFDFSQANLTGSALLDFTKVPALKIQHFETTDLKMEVTNLEPGKEYSILVMAKTDLGHFSHNRESAVINTATTSPVMKSNFTRMVILPEPSNSFQIHKNDAEATVTFKGTLPSEANGLQPLDFVYFFDTNGNATMAQLLALMAKVASDSSVWKYAPSDLGQVFDELDMNVHVSNPKSSELDVIDYAGDPDEGEEDEDYFDEWNALDENVKRDICIIAYPGGASGGDCFSKSNDRRLKKCDWVCRQFRTLKRKAKNVGKAIKSVAKTFATGVKNVAKRVLAEKTLSKSVKFLDVDRSAKFVSDSMEVGVNFDAYGRATFKIRISVLENLHRASMKLEGGFGVKGYMYLANSLKRSLQPAPLELFSKSSRRAFWIGPVPILLTNRPKLSVFMELSAVVEGQALVSAAYGYDYVYEYSYDRRRLTKFLKSSSFVPRDPLPTDPEFNLRINAATELGVTFQWDVVLYELLQGSVALDLALASSIEVGTNVDAMVVTSPYFYTLEKFKIDLLIRVRMMLGFNNNLQRIIRKVVGVVDEAGEAFEHATSFKIPQFNNSLNELPAPLKEALAKAKADATLSNAKFISMAQLNALVPNPYNGVINALTGFDRDFALTYLVFSKEIFLFGLPVVSLEPASEGAEICQGSNAIAFTVESKIEKPAIPFRDGLAKGLWYTNFDGKLFHENSAWEVASARNNVKSISLRLPRSARSRSGFNQYEIESGATVYLRATPEILPVPYGMYEERSLTSMFTVPKFECCFDEDCTNNKNGNKCTKNIDGTNRCYFDQG